MYRQKAGWWAPRMEDEELMLNGCAVLVWKVLEMDGDDDCTAK